MKKIWSILAIIGMMYCSNEAKAQLWRDNNVIVDPQSHYADRNGTYYFQSNTNNNMGTSPNNAVYKNQAEFYNKDNSVQTIMPTANGVHYTPGAQGYNYNGSNFINNNSPGSYNNRDVNGQTSPFYPANPDPVIMKP